LVIETDVTQLIEVRGADLGGIARDLGDVIQHGAIRFGQFCLPIIPPQRGGQLLVQ
jgi:hypothetical protein